MGEHENTAKTLTFEQLADLRERTEAIAQFLQTQLQTYLETLRPLFAPQRFLGKADELILMATRFSGAPAFIELVNTEAVPALQDPLKSCLEQFLR